MGLNISLNIKIIILLLTLMMLPRNTFAFWWTIYHKPAFKGKVIDAETKEPIEGAVIVVSYSKETVGIPEAYSSIIDVKETLTDENGEFYIPSYTTLIQPLSSEDMASFIIFKPGYGSFPQYQMVPSNIKPMDQEVFFSKDFLKEREIELWVKEEKGLELRKFKVTFGVVELPPLKTWEERNKANMISPTDDEQKWPLLHEMIEKEEIWLRHNKGWRR